MSARGYRASLLWFPDPAQPRAQWEDDGLLVVAPDAQGRDVVDAVLEAAHLRFRPILMTSLAFILGVLPLVMASGAGSASQRAIGTGVMGGMISATVLAVFFVPLFYVVVMRLFGRRTHAAAAPPPAPPSASTSPAGSLR